MQVAVFSTKPYDRRFLEEANSSGRHTFRYLEPRLTPVSARLSEDCDAVCVFVNDQLPDDVIKFLSDSGIRLIALRCAGYNNVDLRSASSHGLVVCRVPAYSPHAVAEHTVGLILSLNRKIHRAYNRVRESNFAIDGLLGFDLNGRTVGIVGTGRIGQVVAKILNGFGCHLVAYDPSPSSFCKDMGVAYLDFEALCRASDVITLHCPMTPKSYHLVNAETIRHMRDGAMLINTSRGGLIDTTAVIQSLKTGKLGSVGLDVYEEEADVFFEDLSMKVLQDDLLARLLSFPNVLITSHQAFFTEDAMRAIATTTLENLDAFETGCISESTLVPLPSD